MSLESSKEKSSSFLDIGMNKKLRKIYRKNTRAYKKDPVKQIQKFINLEINNTI